jgi:DNA-binding TFAR19-related protein (PDSD5 family)
VDVRIAEGMLRRELDAMRRVERKQSVSERLVNEQARTSTRGAAGEEEERSRAVLDGALQPHAWMGLRWIRLARMQAVASMIAIAVYASVSASAPWPGSSRPLP